MYYQKCPKCDGQGTVSKPPHVPGDVNQWASTAISWPCDVCNGAKVLLVPDDVPTKP
jgi:DnaJ-class molecular chaperone